MFLFHMIFTAYHKTDEYLSQIFVAAAAKLLQLCPTLCDPIDGSPPGSPVPGILQAGTLEWVAISFSNAWKWKVKVKSFSRSRLFVTPWTGAYQAPLSTGFSRQEYWSGVPLPSPIKFDQCAIIINGTRVWIPFSEYAEQHYIPILPVIFMICYFLCIFPGQNLVNPKVMSYVYSRTNWENS